MFLTVLGIYNFGYVFNRCGGVCFIVWFYAIASLLWVVKILLSSLGFTFLEIYVHNGFYFLDKGLSISRFIHI